MSPLTDFRDLEVWQTAMDLAVLILRAAPLLPADEAQLAYDTAEAHLAAAMPHVAGDYRGEHWLASFALLALLANDI